MGCCFSKRKRCYKCYHPIEARHFFTSLHGHDVPCPIHAYIGEKCIDCGSTERNYYGNCIHKWE